MNEDFRRQRRNLMAVCGVLWLFALAGVEQVQKATITGFGVSLDIERPGALFAALWVLFAYFLFRFCVYFPEEHARVRSTLYSLIHSNFSKILTRKLAASSGAHRVSGTTSIPLDVIWRTPGPLQVHFTLEGDPSQYIKDVQLSRWDRVRASALGVLRFVLLTPPLSDLALPLVMAAVVGVYASRANWGGNMSKLAALLL